MKTVMRSFPLFLLTFIGISVSGCYTEFATSESGDYSDDEYYADTDTMYDDEGNVTINNNYYLDDDYRRSRFRLSFNYYYPSYHSSWIAGYYHSFYDDPYWGWHRPWWWYYHYPHYTIIYPNPWWPPIYDPWYPYPYYPVIAYYPPYYNPPVYGYNPPANPGRIRDNGSTRDPNNPGDRSRPIPPPSIPGTTIATGGAPTRERIPEVKARPVDEGRRDEIPWWKKVNTSHPEKRSHVADGAEQSVPRKDRIASPPPQKKVPTEDRTVYSPPVKNKPKEDRRVDEGTKPKQPTNNPPKRYIPQDHGKSNERPRSETRSYSPPPAQQSPPQSAPPPRSSGGNSGGSNNGGGRKRAD